MSATTNEAGREGLAEQAKSQLGDAASTAQDKAVELKQQGKSKLAETLDERTTTAGSQVRQLADALRHSGSELRSKGDASSGQVAGLAEGAASRLEQLGDYLERATGDGLVRDAEDFARRRPWLIGGISLVAGLAGARFLKASSERRYDSARQDGPWQPGFPDRHSPASVGPAGSASAISGSYSTGG